MEAVRSIEENKISTGGREIPKLNMHFLSKKDLASGLGTALAFNLFIIAMKEVSHKIIKICLNSKKGKELTWVDYDKEKKYACSNKKANIINFFQS